MTGEKDLKNSCRDVVNSIRSIVGDSNGMIITYIGETSKNIAEGLNVLSDNMLTKYSPPYSTNTPRTNMEAT